MATVTGLTAERMLEIEAASVVDGEVLADHLILTKHDGSQIDAGSVIGPTGPTGATGPPAAIDGWNAHAGAWGFGAADAPTYTITAAGDYTADVSLGCRIKLTHASAVKYFIVTGIAFSSGITTLTLFGGTDYTLAATAITNVYISRVKTPHGFPINPAKWCVELITGSGASQGSPVAGTWYNLGSNSLTIPIGSWNVMWQACGFVRRSAGGTDLEVCLSTSPTSVPLLVDSELTARSEFQLATTISDYYGGQPMTRQSLRVFTVKTTLYFIARTIIANGVTLRLDGTSVLRAVSAYL